MVVQSGNDMGNLKFFNFVIASIKQVYVLTKVDIFHDTHKLVAFRIVVAAKEVSASYSMLFWFVF